MRAKRDDTGSRSRSADRPATDEPEALTRRLLALQSQVGNAAVTSLLAGLTVQRVRVELPDASAIETTELTKDELCKLRDRYKGTEHVVTFRQLQQAITKGQFLRPWATTKTTEAMETMETAPAEQATSESEKPKVKRQRTKDAEPATADTMATETPQTGEEQPATESAAKHAGMVYVVGEDHDPVKSDEQRQTATVLGWGFTSEFTGTAVADPELATGVLSGTSAHRQATGDGPPPGVPVESVLVRRLADALTVIAVLRKEVWPAGPGGKQGSTTASAADDLARLVTTMAEVLAIKDLDLPTLADRESFSRSTSAYQAADKAWSEAVADAGQAEQLIGYCTLSTAVLKHLAMREYAAVDLADSAAAKQAMSGIDDVLAAPASADVVRQVGYARSVMMVGLISRYVRDRSDSRPLLIKLGGRHITDIKEMDITLPAAVVAYQSWGPFVKAVPEFTKTKKKTS